MMRIHPLVALIFAFLIQSAAIGQTEPFSTGAPLSARWNTRDSSSVLKAWKNPNYFLPDSNANPLKINVNFIILQKADGTGNFQDNKEDRWFLEYLAHIVNEVYSTLKNRNEAYYPGQNLPYWPDAKIRIVPRYFFIRDEHGWNNRNDKNFAGVPYLSGWYLDSLDQVFYNNPALPKAINLFFTTDGALYDEMVLNKTTTAYNEKVFFKQHAASEIPGIFPIPATQNIDDKRHSMRAHIGNVWLKLWWKRNVLQEPDWSMAYEAGKSIAHELGHLFGLEHTPDAQKDALMRTRFGGQRDYLSVGEIAHIHQAFALNPTLWQFVASDSKYGTAARTIQRNETWDSYVRLYTDLNIASGDTLRLPGTLMLSENSNIAVEPGAVLDIDGGKLLVAPAEESAVHSDVLLQLKTTPGEQPPGALLLKNQSRLDTRIKMVNVKN